MSAKLWDNTLFGSEAKTRGGTLGFPGCVDTRAKNIVEKVRTVFVGERSSRVIFQQRARWYRVKKNGRRIL